jgi:hypothetical protein
MDQEPPAGDLGVVLMILKLSKPGQIISLGLIHQQPCALPKIGAIIQQTKLLS